MARGNMLLILAGCVMLASVCLVQAERGRSESFRFEIYEHQDDSNELDVFRAKANDDENNVGRGVVYSNRATKDRHSQSEHQATVSGLYFYSDEDQVHEISSIDFEDVEINGESRFANSQLNIRGVWNLENRRDQGKQELAIVGGNRGLAGAYGTLRYEKVQGKDIFRVIGEFQIDSESEPSF